MNSTFGLGLVLSFVDNATAGMQRASYAFNQMSMMSDQMGARAAATEVATRNLAAIGSSFTLVGSAVQQAGVGVINTVQGVAKAVMATGQEFYTYRLQLGMLYGEDGGGEAMLTRIKNFAQETSFVVSDLTSSIVMMKMVGVEAMDNLSSTSGKTTQKLVEYATDLASFVGPSLMNRYGTGASAAMGAFKEYIAEGNAITLLRSTGLDITGLLGQKKGKTAEERAQQVADLMELQKIAGFTAKMMGQPSQIISNLADYWTNFTDAVATSGGVWERWTKFIQRVGSYMRVLVGDGERYKTVVRVVGNVLNWLIDIADRLLTIGIKITDTILNWVKAHPELAEGLLKIVTIMGGFAIFAGVIMKVVGVVMLLSRWMSLLGISSAAIFSSMGAVAVTKLLPIALVAGVVKSAWDKNLGGIQDKIRDTIKMVELILKSFSFTSPDGKQGFAEDKDYKEAERLGLLPIINAVHDAKELLKNGDFSGLLEMFSSGITKWRDETLLPYMQTLDWNAVWKDFWGNLTDAVRWIGDGITNGIAGFQALFWQIYNEILIWKNTLLTPMLTGIDWSAAWQDFWNGLKDVWRWVEDTAINLGGMAWFAKMWVEEWITTTLTPFLTSIDFHAAWNAFWDWATTVINWVKDGVVNMGGVAWNIITGIENWVTNTLLPWIGSLDWSRVWTLLWDTLTFAIKWVTTTAVNLGGLAWRIITGITTWAKEKLIPWVKNIQWSDLWDAVWGSLGDAQKWFNIENLTFDENLPTQIGDKIKTWVTTDIMPGITGYDWSGVQTDIIGAIFGFANWANPGFEKIGAWSGNLIHDLGVALVSAIKNEPVPEGMGQAIIDWLSEVMGAAALALGSNLMNGLAEFINGLVGGEPLQFHINPETGKSELKDEYKIKDLNTILGLYKDIERYQQLAGQTGAPLLPSDDSLPQLLELSKIDWKSLGVTEPLLPFPEPTTMEQLIANTEVYMEKLRLLNDLTNGGNTTGQPTDPKTPLAGLLSDYATWMREDPVKGMEKIKQALTSLDWNSLNLDPTVTGFDPWKLFEGQFTDEEAKKMIVGLKTAVDNGLLDLSTSGSTAATNLSTGFANKMAEDTTMGDASKTAGQGVVDSFNSPEGIDAHSPSRKGIVAGANFVLGVRDGIEAAKILAVNSAQSLGQAVANALNGTSTTPETSGVGSPGTGFGNSIIDDVVGAIGAGSARVQTALNGVVNTSTVDITTDNEGILSSWKTLTSSILSTVTLLQTSITSKVSSIGNTFKNVTWKLPKIKLPTISVTWSTNSENIKMPSFSVTWNKKGGIFDSPTIFNTNRGMQGVGEAGAEAIIPLSELWSEMTERMRAVLTETPTSVAVVPPPVVPVVEPAPVSPPPAARDEEFTGGVVITVEEGAVQVHVASTGKDDLNAAADELLRIITRKLEIKGLVVRKQ